MRPVEAMPKELLALAELQNQAIERVERMNIPDEELQVFALDLARTGAMCAQAPEDWCFRNYYDLVLELGTGPRRAPFQLPDDIEQGEVRQCYRNSWELATDFPDEFTYVEGFAMHTFLPVRHAWVETRDGRIVDRTWCNTEIRGHGLDHATYMGVRFDPEVLMLLTLETGWASVFGADEEVLDHRALRYGFTTDEGLVIAVNGPEDM